MSEPAPSKLGLSELDPPKRILIVGGYGVFGGRLARCLLKDGRYDVLVAGRSQHKAEAFCKTYGGTPITFDLSKDNINARLKELAPFIIVDAAGPFQAYPGHISYTLAKAAIATGVHYIDLCDDADFTRGIADLDSLARAANITVLSGVSSVPALSSSIVSALSGEMADIHHIESMILPGNKAPRGLSVIRAITAQAGRPMQIWKAGQWQTVKGWSTRVSAKLAMPGQQAIKGRWASYIGAPDLALFPEYFKARSVSFRAGLDLKLMHGGLALLSMPVRWGWVKNITPLSRLLKWGAEWLKPFGSDRGGMTVRVTGITRSGAFETCLWTLMVEGGDGPFIPAIPAQVMCAKLVEGQVPSGARPALAAFSKAEVEAALFKLRLKTHVTTETIKPLFSIALGKAYKNLPAPLQDLHTVLSDRRWTGEASVTRGTSLLSKIAGFIAGFPPATERTKVEVLMTRTAKGETWTRTFGKNTFRSYLSQTGANGAATLTERFGLLKFKIALAEQDGRLDFPLTRGTCLGIPLPAFLVPKSETCEYVDEKGRPCFDVRLSLPLAGHIVTYKGWLSDHTANTLTPSA